MSQKKSEKFAAKKAAKKARRAAELKRRRSGPGNVWRCPGTEPRWPPLLPGLGILGLLLGGGRGPEPSPPG